MSQSQHAPSLTELFTTFLRLGSTAFGGPAMIPYINDVSVRIKGWLTEESFRFGVAICQSVPGATAMQSVMYVGYRSRGLTGAITAYTAFALPAFALITLLSAVYFRYGDLPIIVLAFSGIKAVITAMILNSACIFARKTAVSFKEKLIASISAILIFAHVNPLAVIIGAAVAGILFFSGQSRPSFAIETESKSSGTILGSLMIVPGIAGGCALLFLFNKTLYELAATMIKIDFFAFGGGYASLPIMLHEVTERGWMGNAEFMDGLALGQITPGPIVITAAFAGYAVKGFIGALTATVAVFTPSFLIMLLAIPRFDKLMHSGYVQGILKAGLISMTGLIAATGGHFILSTRWNVYNVILAIAAFVALRLNIDLPYIVLAGALLSVIPMLTAALA